LLIAPKVEIDVDEISNCETGILIATAEKVTETKIMEIPTK